MRRPCWHPWMNLLATLVGLRLSFTFRRLLLPQRLIAETAVNGPPVIAPRAAAPMESSVCSSMNPVASGPLALFATNPPSQSRGLAARGIRESAAWSLGQPNLGSPLHWRWRKDPEVVDACIVGIGPVYLPTTIPTLRCSDSMPSKIRRPAASAAHCMPSCGSRVHTWTNAPNCRTTCTTSCGCARRRGIPFQWRGGGVNWQPSCALEDCLPSMAVPLSVAQQADEVEPHHNAIQKRLHPSMTAITSSPSPYQGCERGMQHLHARRGSTCRRCLRALLHSTSLALTSPRGVCVLWRRHRWVGRRRRLLLLWGSGQLLLL